MATVKEYGGGPVTENDELSGEMGKRPASNTISVIEEVKWYRTVFTDGSGKTQVGFTLRNNKDDIFIVTNPRENIPLGGPSAWYKKEFLDSFKKGE